MSCSSSQNASSCSRRRLMSATMLVLAVSLIGCGGGTADAPRASIEAGEAGAAGPGTSVTRTVDPSPVVTQPAPPPPDPEVELLTSEGRIVVQLFRDESPVTVENFLSRYVASGFYDDTIFHYVQDEVMIAGGGYTADLTPKETYGEIFNEARDDVKNLKGTIAMARHPDYVNSATSQFFFNLTDNPGFDHEGNDEGQQVGYCVFGKVVAGMDVLERIAKVAVKDTDVFPNVPVEPVVVQSIRRIR